MGSVLEKPPVWAERALQGITYWMGHRRCLYRDYPLAEGALVAEVCNLIHANLPEALQLLCEVQYSSILKRAPLPDSLQGRIRADLVIAQKTATRDGEPTPQFVIEVKRASAPKAQIEADLLRLAAARRLRPSIRTFLFVISEADRPTRYVTKGGHSIRGIHRLRGTSDYFQVRRTWKAAHAFSRRDRAQYACLLEVFPGP